MSGAVADGWYAPALDAESGWALPWTADRLVQYLRTGITDGRPRAAGPMKQVIDELGRASEEDLRSMAVYIVAGMGASSTAPEVRAHAASGRAARLPVWPRAPTADR